MSFRQTVRSQFLLRHELMSEQPLHLLPYLPGDPVKSDHSQRDHHIAVRPEPFIDIKALPLGIRDHVLVYPVGIRVLCLEHDTRTITQHPFVIWLALFSKTSHKLSLTEGSYEFHRFWCLYDACHSLFFIMFAGFRDPCLKQRSVSPVHLAYQAFLDTPISFSIPIFFQHIPPDPHLYNAYTVSAMGYLLPQPHQGSPSSPLCTLRSHCCAYCCY